MSDTLTRFGDCPLHSVFKDDCTSSKMRSLCCTSSGSGATTINTVPPASCTLHAPLLCSGIGGFFGWLNGLLIYASRGKITAAQRKCLQQSEMKPHNLFRNQPKQILASINRHNAACGVACSKIFKCYIERRVQVVKNGVNEFALCPVLIIHFDICAVAVLFSGEVICVTH